MSRSQRPLRKPRALRPGDRVGVVAPAGRVNAEALDRGLALLRSWGLEPVLGEALFTTHGYLAGRDAQRAADFNRFLRHPTLAGIFCARGGYGCQRLLPLIDWEAARRRPQVFVGFSDITVLHAALQSEAGWVTFHGPILEVHDAGGAMPEYNAQCLRGAVMAGASTRAATGYPRPVPLPDAPDAPALLPVVPGQARGRLVGGNIELVTRLLATPWQLDTRGAILLLEEVNEEPYRIDGMLTQLRLAGALDGVAGILFGHSPSCEGPRDGRPSLTLLEVLAELLQPLGMPVLYGFPCGHSRYRTTLPLGVPVELDAARGRVLLCEPGVC